MTWMPSFAHNNGLRIKMPASLLEHHVQASTSHRSDLSFPGTPAMDDTPDHQRTPLSNISGGMSSAPTPEVLEDSIRSLATQSSQLRSDRRASTTPGTPQPRNARSDEREWSLFGQMMDGELEGGLTSPSPASRVPRPTSIRLAHKAGSVRAAPGIVDLADSTLSISDIIASPAEQTAAPIELPSDSEDDYGSDLSDSSTSTGRTKPRTGVSYLCSLFSFELLRNLPVLYRNILKCSLAYLIASLFTFNPYLSSFISDISTRGLEDKTPLRSGHMVATITVYFAPATTTGGMLQADVFCMGGLVYAAIVCLSSMSLFWWLELQPGWEWLGDVIVILWIGISMSLVAWMKIWMANPSFNTACSMTSIILFIVIVKEGGFETLLQVAFIVLCGSITTNIVCYTIWPQRATTNLRTNMSKTLDSFSTILTMLTETFLLEQRNHHMSQEKIQRAIDGHQSSFTGLKKNLDEAKSEWIWRGPEGVFDLASVAVHGLQYPYGLPRSSSNKAHQPWGKSYEDVVDSLTRLAQHLNGLRSGTRLQYELSKAGIVRTKGRKSYTFDQDEDTALLKATADIFGELVDDLGPPLKALSTTCTNCLKRLRETFVQRKTSRNREDAGMQPQEFVELIESIEKALLRFESTSNHAMLRLYRKSHLGEPPVTTKPSIRSWNGEDREGEISIAAGDSEHIFLVYFFIFTLQEFSGELVSLIDAVARVSWLEQERIKQGSWWNRLFCWPRNAFRMLFKNGDSGIQRPGVKRQRTLDARRSFTHYLIPDKLRHRQNAFPKIRPHAPNTILTPSRAELSLWGKVKQRLWSIGTRLQERDIKYAIKAGMATALLAAPAFFDATRATFTDYFGHWALISFFVVMSPTIGATNYLGLHRVVGTLFGAVVAVGVFEIFSENPTVLAIFGFSFSLPCFYYICSQPKLASSGRFVLLTYNLTCLYCYNLREHDVPVVHIAIHRVIAVTAGVLWAAFVSRVWWPAEARRELSKALGDFCLNMGWLYMKLVASNSYSPEEEVVIDQSNESAPLIAETNAGLSNSIREFMAMELHLQIKLIELQGLLAQTQHEPRLKGPFPVVLYRSMLTSLQTILDRLHSMRCVTTKEEWYTASLSSSSLPPAAHLFILGILFQNVRDDFIIPVNKERKAMVGNIILSFAMLSSTFRLKAPLPPYLPPAEESRQHLVEAIRRLDIVKNREAKGSKHLLFFAYAITMRGVTQELDALGRQLQNAFGVIGQTPEEFDALFVQSDSVMARGSVGDHNV